MRGRPLVSIVVIFFNAERFLGEAVQSVFHQTYDQWELLLIDDGSTDGGTALARGIAMQRSGGVRYIEHAGHRNLGKSTSRNVGIQQARGEYIVFLDADDVLLPDKLARQVTALESQPAAAMVYGRTLYWHSWTGRPQDQTRDVMSTLGVQPDTLFAPPTLLTHFLRDPGAVPCLCSLLARRQIVVDLGGFDDAIQHLYEDQVLLVKLCCAGHVYVQSACGEWYRQHSASSSAVATQAGDYHPVWPHPARYIFLTWLARYLSAQGTTDRALRKALQTALRVYHYPTLYRFITPLSYSMRWLRRGMRRALGGTENPPHHAVEPSGWRAVLLRHWQRGKDTVDR